ncbi:heterokaryon incompatibility protein-domain-containing protein [Geopyxis carbonaria]|nr:heterokaryon incompatibility protein-domain-containing protein [Geopyxis carbonaria]
MLCDVCQEIFRGDREFFSDNFDFVWHEHHQTANELQKSALGGCHICAACWSEVSHNNELSATIENSAGLSDMFFTRYSLSDAGMYAAEGSYELLISFAVDGVEDVAQRQFVIEPAQDQFFEHQIPPEGTDSEICFELALKWHGNCIKNHPNCNAGSEKQNNWFPTRLLDLGDSNRDTDPRLRNCNFEPPDGPYMTLSHCWCTAPIVLNTQATIKNLNKCIPQSSLPKTFKDAIKVTKRFGVRYLWIDSLCIIQDSLSDWHYEAARMGDVYKFSHCNIAASRSSSSHGGCFVKRAPELIPPCLVEATWHNRDLRGKCHVIDLGLWRDKVSNAPLNSRAWVVQERLLAPRVLHFTENQLAWECFELDACETYPRGIPTAFSVTDAGFKHLNPAMGNAELKASVRSVPDPAWRFYDIWQWIVSKYMQCGLTKSHDKLIALSGIATHFQTLLKDEYLAGLWSSYLPYQLLWYVDNGVLPVRLEPCQTHIFHPNHKESFQKTSTY